MKELHLLKTNSLPGEIDIHSDILSIMPSALSRKRALKVGGESQIEMKDKKNGFINCILCNKKPAGSSQRVDIIENRVSDFINDFPYLPVDQRVIFLWHPDQDIRKKCLHKFKLKDLRRIELYWLLKGCVIRGKEYKELDKTKSDNNDLLKSSPDLMRMVVGFNLGKLAGQSIPHFHAQYGWEAVLNPPSLSKVEMNLYFEELEYVDLILFKDENITVATPWTPMGQYAVDIYFNKIYNIYDLYDKVNNDDTYIKIFAVFVHEIIRKYISLGIQNLNIVISNSPNNKKIEPLVVHLVPRVNMTALYEIKGVNVVDTPPAKIAEEFRRFSGKGVAEMNWEKYMDDAINNFDSEKEFEEAIKIE